MVSGQNKNQFPSETGFCLQANTTLITWVKLLYKYLGNALYTKGRSVYTIRRKLGRKPIDLWVSENLSTENTVMGLTHKPLPS